MKHLLALFAAFFLIAAPTQAQTLKSLMYNTTNGRVMYSGTNVLTFTNTIRTDRIESATTGSDAFIYFDSDIIRMEATAVAFEGPMEFYFPIVFQGTNPANAAAVTRTNLGLGELDNVRFADIFGDNIEAGSGTNSVAFGASGIDFSGVAAATTRTNLGLGATNRVFSELGGVNTNIALNLDNGEFFGQWTFDAVASFNSGFSVSGNITINQTTATNGLLFIRRTNNEPFLGLANLIASNNTTVSNETLFRVGVAEATNKAAQFGFRSTNTNGNGVAVFSVFGYNALMMIGPSDPAAGTNPIQATVYSIAPTNKVMTLMTTNTGAMLMHRPIGIDAAGVLTNAPANTTNVAGWIQFYVGTNSVRVPYYQ